MSANNVLCLSKFAYRQDVMFTSYALCANTSVTNAIFHFIRITDGAGGRYSVNLIDNIECKYKN